MSLSYDPFLVAGVALYCLVAAAPCLLVIRHAQHANKFPRFGWILLSGMGLGGTVWLTQFFTQLALTTPAPISFDGPRVLLTCFLAVIGSTLSIACLERFRSIPAHIRRL
jgi:NO-binding membrane sensor protein with MHYT domain